MKSMGARCLGLLLALALLGSVAHAQTAYGETFREAWSAMQLGRKAEAIEGFEACLELAPENAIVAYYLACAHARAGSMDEALEWLRAASSRGWNERGVAEWDPDLARLRGTGAFEGWLRGLPEAEAGEEPDVRDWMSMTPRAVTDSWSLVTGQSISSPVGTRWDLRSGRILALDVKCSGEEPRIRELGWEDESTVELPSGARVTRRDRGRVLFVQPDRRAQPWTLRSSQPFRREVMDLPEHRAIVVHADEQDALLVLDIGNRAELARLGPAASGSCAAIAPDGHRIASTCADGTVRIWSTQDGADVQTLRGAATDSTCIAFDPFGELVAAGGRDGRLRIWDVATWRRLHVIEAHAGGVKELSFRPDGTRFLTVGMPSHSAEHEPEPTLWDPRSGRCIARLEGELRGVATRGWSPDGRLVSAGGGKETLVWDGETGALVRRLEHEPYVSSSAWSPDGRRLVVGLGRSRAHVFDVSDWSRILDLDVPDFGGGAVSAVEIDTTGRWLVAAAGLSVHLWDLVDERRSELAWFQSGTMGYLEATFRPDGAQIVSYGKGRSCNRVFVLTSGTHQDLGGRLLGTVTFTPDGQWLVTGGKRLLDTESYRVRLERQGFRDGTSLRRTPGGYYDGDADAAAWSFVEVEGRRYPLDGYAPLLLDPKRVRASLARVDVGGVALHPAPDVEVLEPSGRYERVGDQPVRLVARAESALGILRFEVRCDGERVDSADVAAGTTLAEDGSARLALDVALAPDQEVTDLEIRAVDAKGVAGWPVLRTLHRRAQAPVLPGR